MNKAFLSLATASLLALSASAEGYQINTLSATQLGMGHTGTALHLGAQSPIFNPAGLGWLDKSLEVSGSFTAIFATAKTTINDAKTYETDNSAATPVAAHVAFSVYDNLKFGVSFYTPYGSSINWTDNWPGAVLNQSVSLKTYTLQPTVAYRPIKNLSIGLGLMVTWGSVDLNKSLIVPSTFDYLIQQINHPATSFGESYTAPASVNLKGTTDVAVGVNVGAMYDINDQWTVGVAYRQKMNMKVKAGMASVSYANQIAENILESQLGMINQSQFKAQMPCAAIYKFGVSYKPIKNLTLALDAQLTGWNAYRQLDVEFLDEQVSSLDQHIEKNYHNAWTFSLGAQYAVTNRCDLRAGLMVDTSPVDKNYYNPETPGMTKLEPSVGISFRPLKNFSIDAAFLYVAGLGADNRSCTYTDLLASRLTGSSVSNTFTADYAVHAFIPSIGFHLSF
jgi:long-chain fatty acid transport protein